MPVRVADGRAVVGHAERGLTAGLRSCAHMRVEPAQLKRSAKRGAGAKKRQARAARPVAARMSVAFVAEKTCASLVNVLAWELAGR